MGARIGSIRMLVAISAGLLACAQGLLGQDLDGDLIPDSIEQQTWYQEAGGSPLVKDVWVECDWMPGTVKQRNQLRNRAQKVFDRAPVEGGIKLHLTMDRTIPFEEQWGDPASEEGILPLWTRARETWESSFDGRPFDGANAAMMRPYMHYCMFVNSIDPAGVSGISLVSSAPGFGIPGDLFIVSLGQYQGFVPPQVLRRAEAGTFLHELGHNLGLTHGGANPRRHATHKPNYLSVMNYHHQFGFVRLRANGSPAPFRYWDYSRAASEVPVREQSLSEADGISLGAEAEFAATPRMDPLVGLTFCPNGDTLPFLWGAPIDFDCNGSIASGPVSVDTNLDGKVNSLGKATVDWDRLRFNGIPAAGQPVAAAADYGPIEELDRTLIYWMIRNERRLRRHKLALPE